MAVYPVDTHGILGIHNRGEIVMPSTVEYTPVKRRCDRCALPALYTIKGQWGQWDACEDHLRPSVEAILKAPVVLKFDNSDLGSTEVVVNVIVQLGADVESR